jgi:hypothetical protein
MIGFLTRSVPNKILAALTGIFVTTYVSAAIIFHTGVREALLEANRAALNQLADLQSEKLIGVFGELAKNRTVCSRLDVMNDLVSGDIDKRIARTLGELKRLYGLSGNIYAVDSRENLLATSQITERDGCGAFSTLPSVVAIEMVLPLGPPDRFPHHSRRRTRCPARYPCPSFRALLPECHGGSVTDRNNDPHRLVVEIRLPTILLQT